MKLVKYQGRLPDCVEGFPEGCERSSEGALHFHTGKTADLTDDEFAHIKVQRPDVAANLVVLRDYQAEAKKAEAPAAEPKKPKAK